MAIVSTPHLAMKFPLVSGDILTVHVDQKVSRECYVKSLRVESLHKERPLNTKPLEDKNLLTEKTSLHPWDI